MRYPFTFVIAASFCITAHAQTRIPEQRPLGDGRVEIAIDRLVPVEFHGISQPFAQWDSTRVFTDERVRGENGLLFEKDEIKVIEGRRIHKPIDPDPMPHGVDPALQTAEALHGFDRAVDISVNGQGNTGVNPPDPCMDVSPTHVIQMLNGGSGSYFRVYDKNLASVGAQTYLDNFWNVLTGTADYSGAGDPIVLWDALAERWLMSEFSSSGNRMIVAISVTSDPLGSWYGYSYTATNFPDYPKYAVWSNCYVVTTNENSPAVYALPRANMLAGTTGTAVRFTLTGPGTIAFDPATPVTFDGGTAPPAGAPAMFMRMVDAAWTAAADVDRLELWNINYNAGTPASSTITGPTALNTSLFDTELCGYTSFNCMNQPGTTTTLDPLREVLMNRLAYRNLGAFGYEAIVCSHVADVDETDRGGVRWYELHRTGGSGNPWSIYQQGTWSPDANDRWMSGIAINENGDIGLSYNVSSSSVYPSIRYTGRYRTDPLGQMTFAETSIVAGAGSNSSIRYGDYASLDVDPADGTSFYGTAQYNPAGGWSTRMFKFSFPANTGCTAPVATAVPTCANVAQYNVGVNITNMGSATSINIQVDDDAGGPDGYTTVQTVTGTGNYGPFGPYATGSAVNVRLVHNIDAGCNLTLSGVVSICDGPGTQCVYSSTGTTNIVDNTTVTNSIVVPSLGGATITDLNVFVNLTHSYTADLRLSLQSPAGTIINMIATGLCTSTDNIIVEFDQQAADLIGAVCPMNDLFARPSSTFAGFNGQVMQGTWTLRVQDVATDDSGVINGWCLVPTVSTPNILVSPKVFLEGPYDTGTGLMSDALRAASLIPVTQPFTGLGYAFTGSPGAGGTLGGGVLAVTGNNAIVDWVIVELRTTASPAIVAASCAALVQRDGDVVALDGVSAVSMTVAAGSYHVAVRHRNHLGAMTNAVALSAVTTTVDLTTAATAAYGTEARKAVGSIQALWTGDATFNKQVKYTGSANDRDPILVRVGSTTPNNTVPGYFIEDTNLNGVVGYTGSANDRDVILVNVGSTTPNNTRVEQLP